MIDLQAVENISNPKSEYWPYQKVPELDSKKFLLDENFLPKLNFWLKTFFETRKGKGYWNRANMGFKTGMFKYFNELDEDCSGFLEPDEITSKLEIVCYKDFST